jgi:hypothetical protein
MNNTEINNALRERSGNINAPGKLISFLYVLMRDHLPPGKVEELIRETELEGNGENQYSNGWLAQYSIDLAARLTDDLDPCMFS